MLSRIDKLVQYTYVSAQACYRPLLVIDRPLLVMGFSGAITGSGNSITSDVDIEREITSILLRSLQVHSWFLL